MLVIGALEDRGDLEAEKAGLGMPQRACPLDLGLKGVTGG